MDVPPRKLPPKKEVMIALLAESNVFVHLDPRKSGVIVPKWLQNQPELTLQLGLNMPIPIPDLEVEEDGISCTLSFSRAPFWCKLPWSAVFAIVSEKDRRGVVWPDDVPAESQLVRGNQKAPAPKPRPKLTALGPNDRLEPEPDAEPEATSNAEPESAKDERTPPPDAKCASCATRWPEEQSACPVCGATEWISASADAGGAMTGEAIGPEDNPTQTTPAQGGRPTLVDSDPNAKKRSSARPRGKTNSRPPSPRAVTSRKGPRTRPELVSDDSSRSQSSEGPRAVSPGSASDEPTTLALFPPRSAEPSEAQRNTETPVSPVAGESDAADKPTEEPGNKKPSKRPLPPYLRVVK